MAAKKCAALRNQNGFTLTELMVVLALLGLVLAGIYQLLFFSQRSYESAGAESGIAQEARLFVMRLERDIRNARQAATGTNAVTITENRINIYTDVTADGKPELVVYRLNNGALQRAVVQRDARTPDEYPYTFGNPAHWQTVVSRVVETDIAKIFSINDDPRRSFPRALVNVDMTVADPAQDNTVNVYLDIGIRSQGVAQ